jgi:hypothetical protein
MTSTAVQQISTEDLRQVLHALIEDKNSEFLQIIARKLEKKPTIVSKKTKKKAALPLELPVKKERIPYSELPFWKANPHLKPRDPKPYALKKDFFDAFKVAQESFKDVTEAEWDEWLKELKD